MYEAVRITCRKQNQKKKQLLMKNDTMQQLLMKVKTKDDSQFTVIIAENVQHKMKKS